MQKIKPMLCRLSDKVFDDPSYIWEPKLDGARILAYVNGKDVRLFGRSGAEKTGLFPDLKIEAKVPVILDGEVISGTSFNQLQHRINRQNGVDAAAKEYPAQYMVFDILELYGVSVESFALEKRKQILRLALLPNDRVKETPYVDTGVALWEAVKASHMEGVVGKTLTGTYDQNKRSTWLKVKTWHLDDFMVVGYTKGTGWRESTFGALVLTNMIGEYVGQVGTGFDDEMISQLFKSFVPLISAVPPYAKQVGQPATWVTPFPITVQFLEYTNSGILRFPSFKGVA
jgi:bifunctional non-homologous end joining protein LigD